MYTTCEILDCSFSYRPGRRYCSTHGLRMWRHGDADMVTYKRGESRKRHPLYNLYCNMVSRCNNKANLAYPDYGGRGIEICSSWQGLDGFSNFVTDMGIRPPKATIDRINNDGDYEPGNCRWATMQEQSNNRRSNIMVTINGQTKSLKQWAEIRGLRYGLVQQRVTKYKWAPLRALNMAEEA